MASGRNRAPPVLDGFTLNPLPYPVLFILTVIFIFLGISWYFSYEEVAETAEEQLRCALFVTPVVLPLIVRWLSSMDKFRLVLWLVAVTETEEDPPTTIRRSSPWGVAALIVLLLILVQYQSIFLDSWFV